MAVATSFTSEDGDFADLPLAASVVFDGGDAVCLDRSTGFLVAPSSTAGLSFVGWAALTTPVAVSGESSGDRVCRVAAGVIERGDVSITGSGSGAVLVAADLGKTVYCTGKQAFTVVQPTDGVPCGILTEIQTAGVASTTLGTGKIRCFGMGVPILNGIASGQSEAITALTDSTGGTASNTLAAQTLAQQLTDNSGGTPATTIPAITTGGAAADQAPTAVAIASLATEAETTRVQLAAARNAIASLAEQCNELRTVLVNLGFVK